MSTLFLQKMNFCLGENYVVVYSSMYSCTSHTQDTGVCVCVCACVCVSVCTLQCIAIPVLQCVAARCSVCVGKGSPCVREIVLPRSICIYAHYTHKYTHKTKPHAHTCVYTYLCTRVYIHIHICTTPKPICINTYKHTYIHVYTYIYLHAYTYLHMCT